MFGLFGAFLVLQRRLGRSAGPMVATIGINAVLGVVIPGIAWQAHLGGAIGGIIAGILLRNVDPRSAPRRYSYEDEPEPDEFLGMPIERHDRHD